MAYNRTKDEVYWLERDGIAIAKHNVTGNSPASEYTGPEGSKTVTIFAVKNDENFVASGTGITMTESPAIPDEFHDALAQYAIMKGYETKPEAIQMAGYFRQQWEMCIREGKKYANTGRDGSSMNIKGYDY
tara:strand:- start:259 stop:651 length:393 start_codon:yes stop_codon:yes gene_type:complete